jgi:hypothetical protein
MSEDHAQPLTQRKGEPMRKATRTLPTFQRRHYEALAKVIQGLALSQTS